MRLIRGLNNLTPNQRGAVLTIGNFDGIHLGHQAMLKSLVSHARQASRPSMLMLFEPSPNEYFNAQTAPGRLSTIREKTELLRTLNIDYLLRVRFNPRFSHLSATAFIDEVLMQQLQIHHLMIGEDFHFGHQRQGNIQLLRQAAKQHGFSMTVFPSYCLDSKRISSSLIREYLAAGNLTAAAQLLGRPYTMSGRVVHGCKRGQVLGTPTANILPKRLHLPISGVFIAKVTGITAQPLPAVAHIGQQPSVGGQRPRLEVHILNFKADIYGRQLTVNFLEKIRDVKKFPSIEALSHAIQQDIITTKRYFQITEYASS
jgi:riboflavin kinase / FMN adenylyltransferase